MSLPRSLSLPSWPLLASLIAPQAGAVCPPGGGLTLLHFNDFHGQLESYTDPREQVERGGIAHLAGTIADLRAQVQAGHPGRPVLLLFGGDLLQGTLTSSLFLGVPDLALFGRMGVDAAVMGNHELDYGQDTFRRLAALAPFPILTANVESNPEPLPVRPQVLIERPVAPGTGAVRVAVLGLTAPELSTATHPRNMIGLSVEEPVAVAGRLVPDLREGADLMVVLSHMGIAQDRRLARTVPGIDLIVGGHNHNLYTEPVLEGETAIVQVGERGGWLGRMDFDCRDGHLARTGYQVLPITAASPEDAPMAAEVRRIAAQANLELDQQVGTSTRGLSAQRELIRRGEAPFGDFVADLAREITLTEVALFNGGGFRASIPAGPVTLKAIYLAMPFRNELVVGNLSGEQLQAALERSAALDPLDNPGGFLQVSGLRYVIAGGHLASATLAGAPIDPARRYRVVTSDYLAAGGDGYTMLKAMDNQVMTGRLISDMVIEAFRTASPIDPQPDGRIQIQDLRAEQSAIPDARRRVNPEK
ncbi:bifunctional metallophosphatase/5'-nucleotidase [Candidatus Thiodictyon syntrophicum]|jgi:2',3'-cyclic-nucleotide 2'-phosphodiesterase (5'-nucleotidase family)|uniref:Multifunctional 2',3'-cyclic-nucleotide 2'-phosphodiesterase/5'-nucleotidase/3'-nucleotidase n=1 Tax=Candidatus Thiodictyon syntrophicum TaxID=1166950 RepID=A0A2K8UF14_9GAMM|nr:bifunctional UDP-sugar hydrolase/5'-nucleotidase [Candidatus Thiodictyon syntrophicum]AUB84174.1 multifunctional 2',3'-cyclic-nucleotide 2'-phosphodiesterase/5'-nucleotidase/3'-nucleotidase [Candidatus Thiodictyon syntrophicum]